MAGRPDEPVAGVDSDQRQVVGGPRAQPGGQLADLELEHAGDELGRIAQQLVQPAGGHRRVEAPLLDAGPEHVAAVPPGDEVAALEADDPLEKAGSSRVPKAHDLPLHRSDGDLGEAPRPGAGGEHDAGRRGSSRRCAAGLP